MTSLQLIQKLGIKYPILLSPMAGVSTIQMSNSVAKYGGFGSIPLSPFDVSDANSLDKITNLISQFDYNNNVNVNFFNHQLVKPPTETEITNLKQLYLKTVNNVNVDELSYTTNGNVSFLEIHPTIMDYLLNFRPKVISFHFGVPSKGIIEKFQSRAIMIFVTATSLAEVDLLVSLNVDGIVLQGYEAGGHRGNFLNEDDENLSTNELFNRVNNHLELENRPFIIVSGGIYNNHQIKQYLSQGASGVQLGTIFLSTKESLTGEFFKQEHDLETVMTDLVSGKKARTVKTHFISTLISNFQGEELPGYGYRYNSYKLLKKQQSMSVEKNKMDIGFYLAGENYKYNDRTLTIEQIMENLTKDL